VLFSKQGIVIVQLQRDKWKKQSAVFLLKLLNKFITNIFEPGMVVHTCNPSYSGGRGKRITSSRTAWAKLVRPYLKKKKKERILGMAQPVEHLQHEALNSIPPVPHTHKHTHKIVKTYFSFQYILVFWGV
jgi:hypothetical protein